VITLGYELGTGKKIEIPIRHTAVTGQTQESGKTTTLEALITRSGFRAIGFVTKRGEKSFNTARVIPPYFQEPSEDGETGPMWEYGSSILESRLKEKLKFQRSWIMKVCDAYHGRDGEWEKPRTLAQVAANVELAMPKARGINEGVYRELREYFRMVLPQIESLPKSRGIHLEPGINIMWMVDYTLELQALVMRSVLDWVCRREKKVICIIPEAWKFIPQQRGSPVLYAAEELIRQGAALQNFIFLDSQDIAGVHKNILRQISVWILGVQREIHEAKRTIDHIPLNPKPKVDDVQRLGKGQFFVCYGEHIRKVYVQPTWLGDAAASLVAYGEVAPPPPPAGRELKPPPEPEEDPMWKEKYEEAERERSQLVEKVLQLQRELEAIYQQRDNDFKPGKVDIGGSPTVVSDMPSTTCDLPAVYAYVKERAAKDPGVLELLTRQPEIKVSIQRQVLRLTTDNLQGKLAKLIAEGFFDLGANANQAYTELKRRGAAVSVPNVYRELDGLTALGFLTKEKNGKQTSYQRVPGMKVSKAEIMNAE